MGVHLRNRYFDFGQADRVQIETVMWQNQPNIFTPARCLFGEIWVCMPALGACGPGAGSGSMGPPQPTLPPFLAPVSPVHGAALGLGVPMDIPIIREDHGEPLPAPPAKKKPGS